MIWCLCLQRYYFCCRQNHIWNQGTCCNLMKTIISMKMIIGPWLPHILRNSESCFCSYQIFNFFIISWMSFWFPRFWNWILLSACVTAASVRTVKSRVTVPVAPSFRCMDRAERRKEVVFRLKCWLKHIFLIVLSLSSSF